MTVYDIAMVLAKPEQKVIIKNCNRETCFEGSAFQLLDQSKLDDKKVISIRIDDNILKLTVQ